MERKFWLFPDSSVWLKRIKSVPSHVVDQILLVQLFAAGVKADLYENFTDVDGIFAAHPGVVHKPHLFQN